MESLILGVFTFSLCTFLYYSAWNQYKKNRIETSFLFILLSGLFLIIYTSSDLYLHVWDERYHALVAKNLISNPMHPTLYKYPVLPYDYWNWTGNHTWLHKQPLPLWLMAGSMKLFGINEIALRLPSMIFSSFGIFFTFKIGSYFYNEKTGLLSAFLFSLNGLIIELTAGRVATDHVDISFLFFTLLAIYLGTVVLKTKSYITTTLIGFAVGSAILTKWLTGLIVLPVILLMVIDNKSFKPLEIVKHGLLLIGTSLIIFLPWQFYIFSNYPLEAAYESTFNLRHFTEVIEERSGSIFYFINQIRINYGELIYLPIIWFTWKIFKAKSSLKFFALFIWFMIPLVVFSLAKTKMQGYLLFTAPALFIITSAFFFEVVKFRKSNQFKWLFNIILVLLILLPIRYSIERIKPFQIHDRNPIWVQNLRKLNHRKIKNGILFNYPHPIEAMFYTDLTAYDFIPSKETINELLNEGYEIYVDGPTSNEFIENNSKIHQLELSRKPN